MQELSKASPSPTVDEAFTAQLKIVLDRITDGLIAIDTNWRIIYINPRAGQYLKRNPAELLGKNIWEEFPAAIETQFYHQYHQVMQNQVTSTFEEYYAPIQRWFEVKAYPDANGLSIYFQDITERKQMEAQFLRAQRLEILGTFASEIVHDLNNILTPILAIAQILQVKFPQLDQSSQQLLETLEISARRGSSLVKQVLSFARGTAGQRTSIQVRDILEEVVQFVQQTFPRSIEIRTQLSDLWFVQANATQLHQVFMNLCMNARDAMPNGGALTITAENCDLDEASLQQHPNADTSKSVRIAIADTGIGIDPGVLEDIFDPFFTTKPPETGTGLGLFTVRGIVKNHGGWIDVTSKPVQGTCFQIYLPVQEQFTDSSSNDSHLHFG